MPLALIRRLIKGTPLTAAEHDGNLDVLEAAIDGKESGGAATAALAGHTAAADPHPQYLTAAEGNAAYATLAQGALAATAVQPAGLATTLADYLTSAAAAAAYVAIGAPAPTLVAVRNNSGASLAIGTPVYVTGSSGTRPTVAAADASVEATAAETLGLMAATAGNNADGVVITQGILSGVNTAALTEGQIVWLSETTGALTTTRPTQPAHGVFLGLCVKQGSGTSGILYVNVVNGQELEELHDVLISGATTGQVLARAADGLWKNKTLTAGDVGAAVAGAIGSSGLTMTAGILGRETGTGAPQVYTLGSGLSIVGGALTATGGGGGGYPAFSAPTGFSVSGSGTASIGLTFSAGYSLPTTASQTNWDTAYSERLRWDGSATGLNAATGRTSLGLGSAATAATTDFATAAQGTDSREWTASTITQAEAEAGTSTTRRAFTAQRVFQAAEAWWQSVSTSAGRALTSAVSAAAQRTALGLGTAATAAATDFAAASHTQTASTISDAGSVGIQVLQATTQAAGRSAIGAGTSSVAVSSTAPAALGASASAGSSADAARADHVHARSTYADIGAIGDGLILVVSNKGETATAATNYVEWPVPVPQASGTFNLVGVRFGSHIDNTGSSSTTFNAYRRTAGGTKTSVLTGNAVLASSISLIDATGLMTSAAISFSPGDRIGVDLVGVGTNASGLFAQFIFTRSAT